MKIFNKILVVLSLLGMMAAVSVSMAEDIDIYKPSGNENSNPNILVVIDNSANWSAANQHWPGGIKQGQAELNALRTVIGELGDNVNVGLMMFTRDIDGGYIRFRVKQMTDLRKTAFREMLGNPSGCTNGLNFYNNTPNCIYQNFDSPSEKVATADTDYSAAMFEVFKYFGGYTNPAHAYDNPVTSATPGSPVDASHYGALRYAGLPDPNADYKAYEQTSSPQSCNAYGCWDNTRTDLVYRSPLDDTNTCAQNFVIFIGNGYPVKDSPASLLTGVGGDATQLKATDLTLTATPSQTLLATSALGTYTGDAAGKAACEAAAATTYGTAYTSYTCVRDTTTSTTITNLGITGCGAYPDAASCTTAETSLNSPTYDSVTCGASGSACTSTTTTLLPSACNQFTTQTACEAVTTVGGTTYTSVVCSPTGGTSCSYTSNSGTQTSSCRADVASCNSNAAIDFPGSPLWSSRSCGAVVSTGCTYTAASAKTYCPSATSSCDAQAVADGFLPGYTKTNQSTNCTPGNKYCDVTGTRSFNTGSRYTITGLTLSNSVSFSRTGLGAAVSSFSRTASKINYRYKIYGNYTVNAYTATDSYTSTNLNNADEWALFLNKTDLSSAAGQQHIKTFTIDVFKDAQNQDQTQLLMSMAEQGGGKYFAATDEDAIKNAFRKIFSEIQSVNSVFASSSLPVSVNTQGTYLNQVFMGMFRPDGGASPRWAGNLKQYKFKVINGILRLADKNGDAAISSTTGFVTPCADSFWTTDSGQYWDYGAGYAKGGCGAQTSAYPSAGSISIWSDAPDGDVVEKGGAAQRLRGVSGATQSSTNYLTRALKTCDGSTTTSCTSLTSFDTSNSAIAGANGVVPFNVALAEVNPLINWVRGQDLLNENGNLVSSVAFINEVRPSVHGGVVHSQPAVVDYGGTTGVIAFYGADDGVLHAVNGGMTDASGAELWGFIAPETYNRLYRLKDNADTLATDIISFPADDPSGLVPSGSSRKDYFFDGGISVYQKNSTVWIYPTMRRGGRAIYAFDVSTPASPVLKWRKGCFTNLTSDDANCSSNWTGIGQTWSKPVVGYLDGYVDGGSNPKPVLIFGGGYDQCEDRNLASSSGCGTKGAQVWFVDADTGAIIRKYPTHASVPGDLSVLTDANGNATYVYAADTKGYVYRVKVGSYNGSSFTSWSGTTLGDTDIAYLSEPNHPRKFMNGPNVVPYATFNAVLVGSGDREHPLIDSYACGDFSSTAGSFVQNQFYMLMDQPNASPAPAMIEAGSTSSSIGLVNVSTGVTTSAKAGSITTLTNTAATLPSSSTRGWRFDFGKCEQSVNKPLTIGGLTYFGTNAPEIATACTSNIGKARGYAVDFTTGDAAGPSRSVVYLGGGMPPSPVAGVVEVDGVKMPFIIGGGKNDGTGNDDCASSLEGCKVEINPSGSRKREFWYINAD